MENMNLSDKSKEAMKSETWQEVRGALRQTIVNEYLKTGYADESKEHDIDVSGTTYKVLDRGGITTFYDALGNTLFNVENKDLEAKYDEMTQGIDKPDSVDEKEVALDDVADKDVISTDSDKQLPEPAAVEATDSQKEDNRPAKLVAKEKLEKELKAAKDKNFADPVIGYLLKRCEEDEGMAEDVAQEHKTWDKCFNYIYEQAKKQATGNFAAVRDDVVYEWAEDYYRKDDKAEEEKKAKKAAEEKAKREKSVAEKKAAANDKTAKAATGLSPNKDKKVDKPDSAKEEKPKEQPKPKKSSKDMEGQLDMFSMMGIQGGVVE